MYRAQMDALIDGLKYIQTSKYHVHETVVCLLVGIKQTDAVSTRSMLSQNIVALRSNLIDLEEQENDFNIHIFQHGNRESFSNNLLASNPTVNHEPHWFSFGSSQMKIKKQIAIMKTVTGKAPRLDKAIAKKWQNIWVAWYHKESVKEFEMHQHLPTIARQFCDKWVTFIPEVEDISKRMDPEILNSVAKEIRHILHTCNQVSRRVTRSHSCTSVFHSHAPNVESSPTKRMRSTVSPTKTVKYVAPPLPSTPPSITYYAYHANHANHAKNYTNCGG
jgi:hypothetical protein